MATRALILQALANNITNLSEIAAFARVSCSTASHHLNELIRFGRVEKLSRGEYTFIETGAHEEPFTFSKNFSNFEKRFPGGSGCEITLNPYEKNILLEVLKKENKFTPFSATQIGQKCSLSTKSCIRYAKLLQKKGLIVMKKSGRCWVFVPTKEAVEGFSEYFRFSKKGKSGDRRCSKKSTSNKPTQVSNTVNQSFEECLSYQVYNAHRIILQFSLLRCDHKILEKTAWVFGPKSIHKQLPEAFIFKSFDAQAQKINVLPKEPFIFTTYFEFEDQIREFINQLVVRLKDYDIIIDLSQPAEICLEHRAKENDEFARKAVSKGLLYFESKSIVHGKDGELIQIVTKIDKSSAIHLEFEGQNASQFAMNYGKFVEEVAAGRIDSNLLKELPVQNGIILANIAKLGETTGQFSNSIQIYSENIKTHIEAMESLGNNAQRQTEATEKFVRAADILTEAVEKLKYAVNPETEAHEEIITIVYSRGRAKIPTKILKNSNLKCANSNKKTKQFTFKFNGDYYLLVPTGNRKRKTREIVLPTKYRSIKRGSKLKWWLQDKTICLKIKEGAK